jgi:ABC-2 type transport system permease protein
MWFPVYKRELQSYLHSPVIFAIGGIFFFLMAYFTLGMMIEFSNVYNDYEMRQMYGMKEMNVTEWVIRGFLGLVNFLMLFLIPLLTMRLFAEERKNRTFELLVTCPIRDGEILAGKFLAALTLLLGLLGSCLLYPILVEIFSAPEWPVILSGYLGLILSILAYLSFGIFASSVTENQIIAAFLSFAGLLFFYLVGDVTSAKEGFIGRIAAELSFRQHSMGFLNGVIDLKDVIYFLAFTGFFLFCSLESLKTRQWRA